MKYYLIALVTTALIIAGVPIAMATRYYVTLHNERMMEVGRQQMLKKHYALLAQDALLRRNMAQRIREGIDRGLSETAKNLQSQEADRLAGDIVTRHNIELLIQKDPDYYTNRLCTVPDDMLAERNRIRLNG